MLFALFCTGCSKAETERKDSNQTQSVEAPGNGTNGNFISIVSDNVSKAGYDQNTEIMTVMFKNGRIYEYYGVRIEIWQKFVNAQPHPWSTIGYPLLVQSQLPYRRIK